MLGSVFHPDKNLLHLLICHNGSKLNLYRQPRDRQRFIVYPAVRKQWRLRHFSRSGGPLHCPEPVDTVTALKHNIVHFCLNFLFEGWLVVKTTVLVVNDMLN